MNSLRHNKTHDTLFHIHQGYCHELSKLAKVIQWNADRFSRFHLARPGGASIEWLPLWQRTFSVALDPAIGYAMAASSENGFANAAMVATSCDPIGASPMEIDSLVHSHAE